MTPGGSNNNKGSKVSNKLVGASFAAVLAVYTAGYARTQSAANRLADQVSARRAAAPAAEHAVLHVPQLAPRAPIPARLLPPPAPLPETRIPAEAADPHAGPPATAPAAVAEINTPQPSEGSAAPAHPEPQVPALVASVASPSAMVPSAPAAPSPAAPIVPASPAPDPAPAKPVWKDGTYTGWGYSRHGDIEAAVVITGGRIASASITQCRTRYSCDVIDKLIPQVAQRQSPDVDYVSGATQSADAFYGAVAEALSKAK